MRKINCILFSMLLLLVINVNASDDCDSNELKRVTELAKKVEFDYDYELVNGEAVFSINAVNLNEDLKVFIDENYLLDKYREFKYNDTKKATLGGFKSGEKVEIKFKAFVANLCAGRDIYKKYVKLPYYNIYYDEEKCKGYEDFKYCKQLIDKNISQNEFDKQFELYKKSNEKNEVVVEEPKEDNTKLYTIIEIAIAAIIVIVTLIVLIVKRRNRNKL